MARLSWLADMLAHYVLPRPTAWLVLTMIGVTGAAAALILTKPPVCGSEEIVASYTVNLGAPMVAVPDDVLTEIPAAKDPQHDPARVEVTREPEIPPPEPVSVQLDVTPREPSMNPAAHLMTTDAPPPTPSAPSNIVADVETAVAVPLVVQTTEAAGHPGGSAKGGVACGNCDGTSAQSDSGSGGTAQSYWMSVREAVARNVVYPYRSRSRGIEGRVVVDLTIDIKGRVIKAEALSGEADEDLRRAALRGVMRASPFDAPQLTQGESTITAHVPIQFRLVGDHIATN